MKSKCCCAMLAVLMMNVVAFGEWKIWWTAAGETGSPPAINPTSNAAFSGKAEGSTVRVRWGRNDPNMGGAFNVHSAHNPVTVGGGGDIATTFTSSADSGPWDLSPGSPRFANHYAKLDDSSLVFKADSLPAVVEP